MKVRTVLISGATSFFVLLLVSLGATVALFAAGSEDALYINLAGRQRMLSQKIAKEAFAYATRPAPEARAILERSIATFERTHRALRMSGLAPISLDNANDVRITGTADFRVMAKLDDVSAQWSEMLRDVRFIEERADGQAKALLAVEDEGPRLLALANELAAMEAPPREVSPNTAAVVGHQRVLAQRIVTGAAFFRTDPGDGARASLEGDMTSFTTGHRALRYGGDARPSGPETLFVAAATEPAVIRKLDHIGESWARVEFAIRELTSKDNLSDSLAAVADLNPRLLKTIDEAVTLSQHVVDAKVVTLRNLQLGTTAIALFIVLLAVWYSNRVGGSLADLRSAAENISLGRLAGPVRERGTGEIRDLARSFERMRASLEAAMLDAEHGQGAGLES